MNSKVLSAGGLICKSENGKHFFLLVGSGEPIKWVIPKGMQETGENIEGTACREVLEETGRDPEIVRYVGNAGWTYEYDNKLWDERVEFYLMRLRTGVIHEHDDEFDAVEWFEVEDALIKLYYEEQRWIAHKAIVIIRSGEVDFSSN